MKKLILLAMYERLPSTVIIHQLETYDFFVEFYDNASDVLKRMMCEPIPDVIMLGGKLAHGPEFSDEETDQGRETGVALYRWLRKNMTDDSIPVIVVSSRATALDAIRDVNDPYAMAVSREQNAKEIAKRTSEALDNHRKGKPLQFSVT